MKEILFYKLLLKTEVWPNGISLSNNIKSTVTGPICTPCVAAWIQPSYRGKLPNQTELLDG